MSSPATGSRSSADLPPGTLIAGFRVERVIGRGPRATVYEATQLSLDRRVAFKLLHDAALADRVRRLRWPEHPGAVSLFGAGDSAHGPWIAMRLVGGGTLETRRAPLDQVAAALEEAHAAGIVHGAVAARNVLVAGDGRAFLSDFGLGAEDATQEDDRAALARLVRDHPPPRRRRGGTPHRAAARGGTPPQAAARGGTRPRAAARRRGLRLSTLALAAAVVAAAVLAAVFATGGDDSNGADAKAPPVPSGTRPLGSPLAPGSVESVDCEGRRPSGTSPSCTISQRTLGGRAVAARADGTITSWGVRGARGTLALQVLRRSGSGLVEVRRSADVAVPDAGVHVVRARLPVAAGDRVALLVAPGSAVGIRRGARGASTERWIGPLLEPPRPPERGPGTGLDHELLLRADVSSDAGVDALAAVAGKAAEDAAPGRRLAERDVADGRTVAVVLVGSAVALDLFDGTRRVARAPVAGANGRGDLDGVHAGADRVEVRWRNTDGRAVVRGFAVSRGALRPAGPTS